MPGKWCMSMNETISRKAAIEAIKKDMYADKDYMSAIICEGIENVLNSLPTAEPERKTGKWIVRDNPGTGWYRVTCSECGEDVTNVIPMIGFFPKVKPLWDYCPYCGAKMEGTE